MKYKGFLKLSVQVAITSITMLGISIFTDTQIWLDYFNYKVPDCNISSHLDSAHYHWNYRGWVYSSTGFVYFILNGVRIALSHEEEDFKRSK